MQVKAVEVEHPDIVRRIVNEGHIIGDQLLEMLISDLRNKNYDIINLDEMFEIDPYQSEI